MARRGDRRVDAHSQLRGLIGEPVPRPYGRHRNPHARWQARARVGAAFRRPSNLFRSAACGARQVRMGDNMQSVDWKKGALLSMRANRVAFVLGSPGIGKSWAIGDIHRAYWGAESESKPLITIMGALSDPTSFCGIEAVIDGQTMRTKPYFLREFIARGGGTLFLDEATLVTPATWTAMLRVVNERWVGDTPLPENVRIIMAGNPVEQTNAGQELPPAGANRVLHFHADAPTPAAWAEWVSGHNADKGPHARKAASLVGAFLAHSANPDLLLNIPKDESKRAGAWPSPRSWHAAVDCLAAAYESGEDAFGITMIAASVGNAAGAAFANFARHADLPNPRDVLVGKVTPKLSRDRADRVAAILRACAAEAVNGPAVDKAERAFLVEAAWGIALAACESPVLLADVVVNHTTALSVWRVMKSGAPMAKGDNEKAVAKLVQAAAKASL